MSCEGWAVGDRCEAAAAFKVAQRQVNGPDIVHSLNQGDKGEIKEILHSQPHHHWLMIFWERIQKTLGIPEEQFRYIEKTRR